MLCAANVAVNTPRINRMSANRSNTLDVISILLIEALSPKSAGLMPASVAVTQIIHHQLVKSGSPRTFNVQIRSFEVIFTVRRFADLAWHSAGTSLNRA